jgi:hypothetical protein
MDRICISDGSYVITRYYTSKEPLQQKCHIFYNMKSCPTRTVMQSQLYSTKINMEENQKGELTGIMVECRFDTEQQ